MAVHISTIMLGVVLVVGIAILATVIDTSVKQGVEFDGLSCEDKQQYIIDTAVHQQKMQRFIAECMELKD